MHDLQYSSARSPQQQPLLRPRVRRVAHAVRLRRRVVARADDAGLELRGAEGAEVERRCPYIGLSGREGLLEPMLLWDAAMAHAIARSLDGDPSRLVIHMCGSFHCERNLGVAEMLQVYRPATKTCTVVIYPEEDCHTFEPSRHAGMGDYVVLTDASLSRSYDYMA